MKTAAVTLKDRNDEKHHFEQVTSLEFDHPVYLVIDCANGSQFLFNHNNVREVEIQPND